MGQVNSSTEQAYDSFTQINKTEYGMDFVGIIIGAVCFIAWILKTENNFKKKVDDRIDKKLELHTLQKAPLYKDVQYLKDQHSEILERMVKSSEDLSRGMNKLVDKIEKVGEGLVEVKIEMAELKVKLEDR
jgi:uncharacterized phage infection (PIP) family protein YhgE